MPTQAFQSNDRPVGVAPPLVWPPLLELPPATVTLVYLDLNHWISLAQASVGHPHGRPFAEVLEFCQTARTSGTTFVLSGTHYFEMLKIKDPSQRRALADVMEQLTDFATLVSRVVVMNVELGAALDRVARPAADWAPIPLVGRGVRHAFGISSGLRIMGPTGDETGRTRGRMGEAAFAQLVAEADLRLERSVLRGPADDEVEKLRAFGWDPAPALEMTQRRALQEQEQIGRLDSEGGKWRRGRLRDVIAARELISEFENILPRALAARGLRLEDVASDPVSALAFVRAMPSTEVSIELKTCWHRNPQKRWLSNDIHDIDGLALAVPYCDIVVIDKACHHALTVSGVGERMHTALLRNLGDLPEVLSKWRPTRPRPSTA